MRTSVAGELDGVVDQVGEAMLEFGRGGQLWFRSTRSHALDGDIEVDLRTAVRVGDDRQQSG